MATVNDLYALFEAMLGQNSEAVNEGRVIRLLAQAGKEAWKCLVTMQSDDNWFVAESQSATPANPDYFANFVANTRDYVLPPDFHGLRMIEVVSPTDQRFTFKKRKIDDQEFEERRNRNDVYNESTFLFAIVGPAPGRMLLDAPPVVTIDAKLWYVKNFTLWTALTDSTAEIPDTLDTLMVEWALKRYTLGIGDQRWTAFQKYWEQAVYRSIQGHHRDVRGPEITDGVFEE